MSTTNVDPREALVERIVDAMTATMETFAIHLGARLGLYAAMADGAAVSAAALATQTKLHPRPVREWLEQQAAAGVLELVDDSDDDDARTYRLPPAHAEVLADRDSAYYGAAGPISMAGVAAVLPAVLESYRTGDGVPYADFGPDLRDGIADFNRPMFLHELGSSWLPAIPDVHDRLSSEPAARVLDLGCGAGASTLAIASAYPLAEVIGVDLDPASVDDARDAAEQAGMEDHVVFHLLDAAEVSSHEKRFDLVTIFEALHDMADPAGALRSARALLAEGGSVLIADERAAERFTAPANDVERFFYGWSVLHCLPATMAEHGPEAAGTALRPSTVERWAKQAGFSEFEVLDIDNPFWRFYRIRN
ncbi:MAG: class I SAM-dependent methyltransferase [Candidatus Nanopelagicales bacterium]